LGSRPDKDPAPPERLVDHAAANLSPLLCVVGADDHKVDGDAEVPERFTEPHELRAAALQVGLDREPAEPAAVMSTISIFTPSASQPDRE
jgi:hypothetical protein